VILGFANADLRRPKNFLLSNCTALAEMKVREAVAIHR